MSKHMFSKISSPTRSVVEIRITEPNPPLRRNPYLQLFPYTSQPLVETSTIEDNPSLELCPNLTLQLFTAQSSVSEPIPTLVPESKPVQTPIQTMFAQPIPPSQPLPESTLFQFDTLFPQLVPPPQQPILYLPPHSPPHTRPREQARRDRQSEITETIDIPFKWATNRIARVQSFRYLIQNEIFDIKGDVECKKCERKFEMSFDVREKFPEISDYILKNSQAMNERAPPNVWMNPTLSDCIHCNKKKCVKPIITEKNENINWLFLFLGQMLGCCNLEQLKHFCKYNDNHRTGAKDRVLYSTYLALCKQLHST